MGNYVHACRFLVAVMLAILVWADLATGRPATGQAAELPQQDNRPTSLTSRGGARPPNESPPGYDILVTRPEAFPPTPTQTPSPSPDPPTPTPTAEPNLKDLGMLRISAYYDSPLNGTDGRGITATGAKTHWGVVAVDPVVIPLGSKLTIEGMGDTVFTALDTGGGVKGHWVDVWFATDWEAIRHGMRQMRVHVVK